MNIQRKSLLLYWVVCLAAILVYWPGLQGPFLFDDSGNIVKNTAIQITALSTSTLTDSLSGPTAGPLGRPISVLSFALTHYAFGLDPFAFKAINLFIHLLNGLLAIALLRMLLRNAEPSLSKASREWLPLWVGAIWVLHPINVIPVLMAVQRMTLLAGLFIFLALICHVRGLLAVQPTKRWAWLAVAWLVAWPLAVLSKETAVLFPLYALTLSWALMGRTPASSLRSSTCLGLAITAAGALAFMAYLGTDWLERGYAMRPFTLYERILTELRVLWMYAGQILLPSYAKFGLFLDDFPISRGLIAPIGTAIALAGWLAVLLACALLLPKHRLVALSIFWFLLGHSLESGVLPLEIAHEYRNYLPSLGLILACGMAGVSAMHHLNKRQGAKTVVLALGGIALVLAPIYSAMRSMQYGNALTGAQIEVSYHPNSSRANYSAAKALMESGYGAQGDPAGEMLIPYYLKQSGKLDPSFKHGYIGLLGWACATDRPLDSQWLDELGERLQKAPYGPKDGDIPMDLMPLLLANTSCITRTQATGLFRAGSKNLRIDDSLRATFLEAAADYELLAHSDFVAATLLLSKAMELSPHRRDLREKRDSLERAHKQMSSPPEPQARKPSHQ